MIEHTEISLLGKDDIIKYLKCFDYELNKLLNKRKVKSWFMFDIYIFGGAAILLSTDARRLTQDIDVFYIEDSCLEEAAVKVAERFGLDRKWINTSIKTSKSYSNELLKFCEPCFTELNLHRCRLYKAPLSLLLCMKLIAFRTDERTHDVEDIETVIKTLENLNIKVNADFIYSEFDRYFLSRDKIGDNARSFIESR